MDQDQVPEPVMEGSKNNIQIPVVAGVPPPRSRKTILHSAVGIFVLVLCYNLLTNGSLRGCGFWEQEIAISDYEKNGQFMVTAPVYGQTYDHSPSGYDCLAGAGKIHRRLIDVPKTSIQTDFNRPPLSVEGSFGGKSFRLVKRYAVGYRWWNIGDHDSLPSTFLVLEDESGGLYEMGNLSEYSLTFVPSPQGEFRTQAPVPEYYRSIQKQCNSSCCTHSVKVMEERGLSQVSIACPAWNEIRELALPECQWGRLSVCEPPKFPTGIEGTVQVRDTDCTGASQGGQCPTRPYVGRVSIRKEMHLSDLGIPGSNEEDHLSTDLKTQAISRTDIHGIFRVSLPPGKYSVWANDEANGVYYGEYCSPGKDCNVTVASGTRVKYAMTMTHASTSKLSIIKGEIITSDERCNIVTGKWCDESIVSDVVKSKKVILRAAMKDSDLGSPGSPDERYRIGDLPLVAETTSDEKGNFIFAVTPGRYSIWVRDERGEYCGLWKDCDVTVESGLTRWHNIDIGKRVE